MSLNLRFEFEFTEFEFVGLGRFIEIFVTWSGHMIYGESFADHVTENLNKSASGYKKFPQPNITLCQFFVGHGNFLCGLL